MLLLLGGQGVVAAASREDIEDTRLADIAARAVGGIRFLMTVAKGNDGAVRGIDRQTNIVGMGPAESERLIRAGCGFGIVIALEFKGQAASWNLEVNVVVDVISGGEIHRVFGSGLRGVVITQSLSRNVNV